MVAALASTMSVKDMVEIALFKKDLLPLVGLLHFGHPIEAVDLYHSVLT